MPFLAIPAVAGAIAAGVGVTGSLVTAGVAAATGAGKVDPNSIDPAGYKFGKEGQDFINRGDAVAKGRQDVDPYAVAQQQKLVAQLQERAAGRGPSAAQATLQAGNDRAIQSAMAMAGSARGGGLAGAQLGAVNAGTQATQGAANASAGLRAQEQQAATTELGGVLGGMSNVAEADAARRNQLESFYMNLGNDRDKAALLASIQLQQDKLGITKHNAETDMKYFTGAGQAFSALGASGNAMMSAGINAQSALDVAKVKAAAGKTS